MKGYLWVESGSLSCILICYREKEKTRGGLGKMGGMKEERFSCKLNVTIPQETCISRAGWWMGTKTRKGLEVSCLSWVRNRDSKKEEKRLAQTKRQNREEEEESKDKMMEGETKAKDGERLNKLLGKKKSVGGEKTRIRSLIHDWWLS